MSALEREFEPHEVDIEWLEEFHRDVMLEKAQIAKLIDTKGWKLYIDFVEGNAATLAKATTGAVFADFGDVFSDQFAKGKAEGLRRAPSLLGDILGVYDRALDEIQALIREKNNGSRTISANGHAGSDNYDGASSDDGAEPDLFDPISFGTLNAP